MGYGPFSTSTPSCTPGPKFLREFLELPERCQMPSEFCQNLFPVASYGRLNISKIATLGANITTTPDPEFKIILSVDRASAVYLILKKWRTSALHSFRKWMSKLTFSVISAAKSVLGQFEENFDISLRRYSTSNIDETCKRYSTRSPFAAKP